MSHRPPKSYETEYGPKIKHMGERRFGGYLTPSEAIKLIDRKDITFDESDINWVKKKISEGISNPNWIYFRRK